MPPALQGLMFAAGPPDLDITGLQDDMFIGEEQTLLPMQRLPETPARLPNLARDLEMEEATVVQKPCAR